MRIIEVCPYSAGSCGVYNRVMNEAKAFKEMGYEVKIFSSDATKGSEDKAKEYDEVNGIKIRRFPCKKLGGESFMKFNFLDEAMAYLPDIIIAHNYRHLHTTQALKVAYKLNALGHKCKVILVTHAPFIEGNSTRSFISSIVVNSYDRYIGPRNLKKFDAIVRITNWEEPYLLDLGVDKNKMYYIPNTVPDEFFIQPAEPEINNSALFLGRVAPIKNIEFILALAKITPEINYTVVGPIEDSYMKTLSDIYPESEFPKNVAFYGPITDLQAKIKAIDYHKFFILPSIREAMPQSLLEALARGKIAICTATDGAREIITSEHNGFICEKNTIEEAATFIRRVMALESSGFIFDKKVIIDSVKDNFSMNTLKDKYKKIFQDLRLIV
jgi:glycosyltransferase involved in cell wall biosynthesis